MLRQKHEVGGKDECGSMCVDRPTNLFPIYQYVRCVLCVPHTQRHCAYFSGVQVGAEVCDIGKLRQ